MDDYKRKRIEYINQWPNTELFEAEVRYYKKCDNFIEINAAQPFLPMEMWYDVDKDYNIAISRLIECLEAMPYKPHHAFSYAFICFDSYSEAYANTTTPCNLTDRLKIVAQKIDQLAAQNSVIDRALSQLLSAIPMQCAIFIYNELYKNFPNNKQTYNRMIHDCQNIENPTQKALFDDIYRKYGYNASPQNNTVREGAALLRKMMVADNISVNSNTYTITRLIRLHLLLSGFLYSLRNRTMHGDSLSTTKSSQTDLRRYALNYYAFLSQYCICVLMMMDQSSEHNKSQKFVKFTTVIEQNIINMKSLFGANMG